MLLFCFFLIFFIHLFFCQFRCNIKRYINETENLFGHRPHERRRGKRGRGSPRFRLIVFAFV